MSKLHNTLGKHSLYSLVVFRVNVDNTVLTCVLKLWWRHRIGEQTFPATISGVAGTDSQLSTQDAQLSGPADPNRCVDIITSQSFYEAVHV
jgi:hypothetical protein